MGRVGDVVRNQGKSLEKAGIDLDYFLVKPGLLGYIFSVPKLRKVFLEGSYDLVHAHYSLSGYIAGLAGCKPLVVSLMGSDVYSIGFLRKIIKVFIRNKWNATIVKTWQMKDCLGIESVHVIPNGVDIERFKPMLRGIARHQILCEKDKKLIVFIAGKNREEKNLDLALDAIKLLANNDIDFRHIYGVPNQEIPYYLNAADVLLLTSKREGSVNVVKEAMACNCPIVTTNVGDTRWVIGDTEGCFFSSYDISDCAEKIKLALEFGKRTNGSQRIIEIGLDSETISRRIKEIYKQYLPEEKIIK